MTHCHKENAVENDVNTMLLRYQRSVEEKIQWGIKQLPGNDILHKACEYALLNGGKRFRPSLVLMVANALGHHADATQAALAIEYFHTASLVVDDLPSMDDDDLRRSKPSTHKVYGEAAALLVSYALIGAGYGEIAANVNTIRKDQHLFAANCDHIGIIALENAAYNTGLMGATGGQFLDLFPPDLTLPTIRDIIHKKTISLFEIAFVFGWLFGGGNLEALNLVKQAASHFGMAFQIADDLDDIEQDAKNGRNINVALAFGLETAKKMFHEEISEYKKTLKKLNINVEELSGLASWLESQV